MINKEEKCDARKQILEIDDLSISFSLNGNDLPAVSNLSLTLNTGEILALVGESGCGKSVTCMSITRLLPEPPAKYVSGKINLYCDNRKVNTLEIPPKELRKIRGNKIAYVFQEPSVSLNPVFTIGEQIAESIELHRKDVLNIEECVIDLLKQVGIPEPKARIKCYPHEMSGGMLQRVMIAMALASEPDILIADEPTTALDVTVQAQILELLCDVRKKNNMSIILVSHNLGIVEQIADRVLVMYAGHTVEEGIVKDILEKPIHPYTKALLSAIPTLEDNVNEELSTIAGQVPTPDKFPKGCRFFDRCEFRKSQSDDFQEKCRQEIPKWHHKSDDHFVRCHKI